MDFISLSQEMFEVSFSAEQQVTPVITRDDLKKNDLVACSVSADLLILTYYFQNMIT